MKKIVEVLPHTPILACGINFYFFEERPHPDLLQKIKANDGLEAKFEVAQEQIASRIRLESATELNLIHKNDKSSVAFDFNFHRSGMDGDELTKQIDGEIQGRMEQAMDIMKDIYALSTYEVLMHQFASNE